MRLTIKKIIDYYEIPILLHCMDDMMNNYLFVCLQEDQDKKVVYMGKKIEAADFGYFVIGNYDLLTTLQNSAYPFQLGQYEEEFTSKTFLVKPFDIEFKEEMLPDQGIFYPLLEININY